MHDAHRESGTQGWLKTVQSLDQWRKAGVGSECETGPTGHGTTVLKSLDRFSAGFRMTFNKSLLFITNTFQYFAPNRKTINDWLYSVIF